MGRVALAALLLCSLAAPRALAAPAAGRAVGDAEPLSLSTPALCAALASPEACDAAAACAWRADACGPLPPAEAEARVAAGDSACEAAQTEPACAAAAADCRWCISRAVPSMCVAAADAARLPPSVFKCAPPADGAKVAPA